MGWSRLTINIFLKIKSFRTEDDAVRLVRSRCHLLRAVKTWWIVNAHRYHQQLIKLHRALREKKAALSKKTWQSDFPPRQRIIAHINNDPKLLGDTQLGSATLFLTHQTWHLLTITCFRRCATLNGTSILTKTSENGLMSGLPRKMRKMLV